MLQTTEVPLSPATAAFVQSGVSIRLASCAGGKWPVSARALAASVDEARLRITLVLEARPSRAFVEAVRAGGMVAAAFTQPTTHRSIQIKGGGAVVHDPGPGAADLAERHARAFSMELRDIDFPEPFITAHVLHDPADLVCVTFSCGGAFDQTPGPRAGDAVTP